MADYSAKVVNMARALAIVHIIVGSFLICFGIADVAVHYFWTGYGCWGIWMGVWMCIAGGLGIPGTRKERNTSRNAFAGVFMGFSITSAVFGGAIIIIYSIGFATYGDWHYYDDYDYDHDYYNPTEIYYRRYRDRDSRHDTQMAIMALMLILGIVEFVTGIWVAVCLCLMKPCTCCNGTPPQQVHMYAVNPGYSATPYPADTSTPSPMQAGVGMVAVPTSTSGPQAGQPQMVMLPVSGAGGGMVAAPSLAPVTVGSPPHQVVMVPASGSLAYPPQVYQAPTTAALPEHTTTVYQPQQVSHSSAHGGYTRLTNEEDPVDI